MIETHWQAIEPVPFKPMNEARRQAHNAVHWLVRIANSYLDAADDNAHVELLWNDGASALRTRTFGPDLSVELRLGQLEMQFCEHGEPAPHVLALQERTPAHIEAWILVELLHRGVDRDRFSKDLPYLANDLMLGDHEEHEVRAYETELLALNGWMKNGAAVLTALRHDLGRNGGADLSGQAIVLWPQTFQLGLEVPLPRGSGARALRAGLSAGGSLRPEPFFFIGTKEQALSADFDASSVLSVRRIAVEKLAADDVIRFLREEVAHHRKRLAS